MGEEQGMAIVFRPKDDFSGDYSAGIGQQQKTPETTQSVPENTGTNNPVTSPDQLTLNGTKLANLDQRLSALKLSEDAFDKQAGIVGGNLDSLQAQLSGITDRSVIALQTANSALNETEDAQKRVNKLKETLTGLENDLKAQTDSLKPSAELLKSTGDIQKKIAELRGDIERIKKQIADLEKSLGLPVSVTYDPVLATLEPDADIPAPATLTDAGPVLVNPVRPNEATKPNILNIPTIPDATSTPDIPSNPTGEVSSVTPVLPTSVKKVGFDGLISPIIDFEKKKGLSEWERDRGHSNFGINDRGKVKFGEVKNIEDAKKIYRENYWAGMEDLPEPLAAMALDTGINQGEWAGSLAVVANRLSNGKVGFNKERRDDLWYDEKKNNERIASHLRILKEQLNVIQTKGAEYGMWDPRRLGQIGQWKEVDNAILLIESELGRLNNPLLKSEFDSFINKAKGSWKSIDHKQLGLLINLVNSSINNIESDKGDRAKYDGGEMNYKDTKVYKEYEKKKAEILAVYNADPEKFLKELAVLREQMYSRAGKEGEANKFFQGWTERNIRNYDFAMSLQKGNPVVPNLNDPEPARKAANVAKALDNAKGSKDERAWFDAVSGEISKVLS